MKKAILIVIVIGMLGWAMYDFISSSDKTAVEDHSDGAAITSPAPTNDESKVEESDEIGLTKGKIAPDFELTTLQGETVHLSDYRGKRVIINFWATWCPPCRAEIPDLQKLYEKEDVVILAVNLTNTEESKEKVADFVKKYGMTFPVLMDVKGDVSTTYRVQAYPTSYMVDSSGHIQFAALGAMNYDLMIRELAKIE